MKKEANNTTTVYGGYEVTQADPDTVEVKHPEKKIGYHLIGKEIEVKKFVFTIEIPGMDALQSPELNAYGKAGRIYFSRFGVVKNERMKELDVWPAGEASALSPVNAPALEGFSYCRKPLRDGYLYVYDEYDSAGIEDVFHEYEVRNGRLQEIIWTEDNTGDVRKAKNPEFTNYHLIPPKAQYVHVAYSDTQWSAAYVAKMMDNRGDEAKELRKKRFRRITVAAWSEIGKDPQYDFPDEVVPASKVQMVIGQDSAKTDLSGYAAFHAFHDFHLTDCAPSIENEEKDPTLYLTLDDPIGAANDLRKEQLQSMGELTDLLEKIMLGKEKDAGEDPSYIYLYMQALSFYKMFHADTEEEDSYFRKLVNRLFNKELSEEPEEKEQTDKNPYFDKLKAQIADHKFFEKILLTEEREAIRDEANKVREQLARLVDSDYYRKVIDDYMENIPTRLEEGIEIITEHHKGVAWDANLIDRHIDIKDTSSPANEKIRQYMEEVFYNDNHKISQLFSTTYNIEDYIFCEKEEHRDIELVKSATDKIWYNTTCMVILWNEYAQPATKANQTAPTTVETSAPTGTTSVQVKPHPTKEGIFLANTKQGEYLIMNTKWLNRPKIVGRNTTGPLGDKTRIDLFNIEIAELKTNLTEMGVKRNEKTYGLGRGSKGRTGVATKRIAEISDLLPDGAEYFAIKVTSATKDPIFPPQPSHTSNALPDIQQNTSSKPQTTTPATAGNKANKLTREKFNDFLPEIFATKAFMGLTSIVSACNLVSIFRNADFKNHRGYSYAKLLAAATEVGQFIFYFGYTSEAVRKLTPQIPLNNISTQLSIVSTGFTGIVTLMDGWKSLDSKNHQRSLACIGSSIYYFSAFGVQTIQLLSSFKKFAHLKIPKGDALSFILTMIAGGIGYWADALAFDPYQEFLRNCILSKDAPKKLKNWKESHGLDVLQQLYEKRNTIVSEEFEALRDMETSIKEFISYQSNIFMEPDHTKRSETTTVNNRQMRRWTTNYLKFNKLTVHCAINEIYFDSELDYALRIFYFTDEQKQTLYYVDVDGKLEETPMGCAITFQRNALQASVPYATEIVYACFCQRIIYSNGWCQPPEREIVGSEQKEAVYWVARVHLDYDYTTQPIYGLFSLGKEDGDPKKAADQAAYQRKENRCYLTLEEVTNILKKDRKSITQIRSMNPYEYIG